MIPLRPFASRRQSFAIKWVTLWAGIGLVLISIMLVVSTATGERGVQSGVQLNAVRATVATGPLRANPNNGRYFTDGTGKAIYLTGSHTWANFQDVDNTNPIRRIFDYDAFLNFLVTHNHNFFRLWHWEESWDAAGTGDAFWLSPSPYQRPGPGNALDGKPKFDLAHFNQGYFDRLRSRVSAAGQKGIYVSIMLFDGWSIENKDGERDPWRGHPFNSKNNINAINGDPNGDGKGLETHMLQVSAITDLQKAYLRKVIDTVNDLDNVLYEISNESHSGSQNWQYAMINYIKSYEAGKKQHPVGMTVEYPNGNNTELFASPADWISPKGDVNNPAVATGSKVILSDTDHLCGVCGDETWVWKSITRGLNPIFMDLYDWFDLPPGIHLDDPKWELTRKNLGYALTYANRMNLAAMTPHGELSTSGYTLANPSSRSAEYLVYLPSGGTVTVDLTSSPGPLYAEWLDPHSGINFNEDPKTGGSRVAFTAPFSGDAVLYICQVATASKSTILSPCIAQYDFYLPMVSR